MQKNRLFAFILCGILASTPLISMTTNSPLQATQVIEEEDSIRINTKLEMMDKQRNEIIQKKINEQNRIKEEAIRLEQQRLQEIENRKEHILFEVSFYCSCTECCSDGLGITASGKQVEYGMVALPSNINFGSSIYIENLGTFINEDTGSFIQYTTNDNGESVMRVDIYVESHSEALARGRYEANGYLIRK